MKIVFLSVYSGKMQRGAENQIWALSEKLKKNHEVRLFSGESDQISAHQFSGNVLQRWFNRKRWFVDPAGIAILTFTLKNLPKILSEKPDWVIPVNGFWQLLFLKLLQPIGKYKILVTGHSGPGWDERWNLYLMPTIFVAISKPGLDWAQKTAPWITSVLIPNGYDLESVTDSKVKEKEAQDITSTLEKPIILCPSALVPYKRVDLVIKAVAQLKNCSLLILGNGSESKKLELLASKLIPNRYRITSVDSDLMPYLYKQAAVVTLASSSQENLPMVFVEAIASRIPVVTTDTPRNRWALESAALYVDPVDSDIYANALYEQLHAKKIDFSAVTKFSWDVSIAAYEEILASYRH